MKRVAYLECPTGIAGDMCLGALIHAGVPLAYLIEQLSLLGITEECKLWAELVHRNGQQATKVHVDLRPHAPAPNHPHPHPHPHTPTPTPTHSSPIHPPHAHHPGTRHLPEIEQLITSANLPPRAANWSLAVFRRLAEAEGAVHGIAPEQVHFHEVGAVDAIIDIVGTCLGLDWLGIDELYCSPLPTGGGTIRAAHGLLPVPAPAVLKLWQLRQTPIYSNGIQKELVTPTGAAIVTTLVTQFGAPPPMTLMQVGLGAGSIDLPLPNILRLWIGEATTETEQPHIHQLIHHKHGHHHNHLDHGTSHQSSQSSDQSPQPSQETIAVLETQIDDLSPQAIGYLLETLLAAGALDVFTQAIGMKKSRPGILLTVICHPQQVALCEAILFRETTTLGIRHTSQRRSVLQREFQTIQLPQGEVRIKLAQRNPQNSITNAQPEFEDCAALARQHQIPWQEIHRLALHQWYQQATDSTNDQS